MYFSHQSSGGRGEYEIAGQSGTLTAPDLEGHQIYLNLGQLGVKNTGLIVRHQGGKWRLRSLGTDPLIQRQVGSILLLPNSTRDRRQVSDGLPVIIEKRYTIDRIDFEITNFSSELVEVAPTKLIVTSSPVGSDNPLTDAIDFQSRLTRVSNLTNVVDQLPTEVGQAIKEHAEALQGASVGTACESATRRLMKAADKELPQTYLPGTDPLPAIELFLGAGSLPAIDPTQVPADHMDIRRRLTVQLRLQKDRGASAAKFRKAVQQAYDYRCVFCGLRLPLNDVCTLPGVDAAHILPWAKYDLDVVQNGLILCKMHHWAFDQQILTLNFSNGIYSVSIPKRVQGVFQSDPETLKELTRHVGPVEAALLPVNVTLRPNPQFLEELYKVVSPEEG